MESEVRPRLAADMVRIKRKVLNPGFSGIRRIRRKVLCKSNRIFFYSITHIRLLLQCSAQAMQSIAELNARRGKAQQRGELSVQRIPGESAPRDFGV